MKGREVSFRETEITGGFWKERQDRFRSVTIDAVYDRFEETGRFEALKGGWKEGMPGKPHIFWDSDAAKWIEGAAYFLQKKRDEKLEARVDELIARLEKEQCADGYLNTYFTSVEPEARFTRQTEHELYCAGHLAEAAIAYAQATGKTKLLEITERYLTLIDRVFRVEHTASFDVPGHEEIELALFRLYEYTGKECWKTLAEYFLNERGCGTRETTYPGVGLEYMQSHLPVRRQREAVGHCVRALYLYSAMADMARADGDKEMEEACRALFADITGRKMAITGGVGSTYLGEAFTFAYDLPEYTAYNETCASIALAMFCRRMWLLDADGKYADCAERAIYNTVLSGISLSGDHFFYENPLAADPERNRFSESRGEQQRERLPILERVRVFDCSCCPPNLLRMVGSIADYMYSISGNTVYAHCYMEGNTTLEVEGKQIGLEQRTAYPYGGTVAIRVTAGGTFTMALHIPGWAGNTKVTVNKKTVSGTLCRGYFYLEREWKTGDELELVLPMQPRVVEANPRAVHLCGRAAVQCGPLVFCAEKADSDDWVLRDVRIRENAEFERDWMELAGIKIPVLKTVGQVRAERSELYTETMPERKEIPLELIPYFAWANRGVRDMTVWLLVS